MGKKFMFMDEDLTGAPNLLAGLSDVDISTTPQDGDTLVYNATSGKWEKSDIVSEINSNLTKNVLDTYVDISGYASTNNKYTIPDDGYLEIGANGQTSQWNANFDGGLVMYVNGGYNAWNIQSMFVRKGMQVYISSKTGSGHARYFKLKSAT